MNDRQNTIVCVFDPQSPRITVFQIHEWIHERLHLPQLDVRIIHIDGPRRSVYIKLATSEQSFAVVQKTAGNVEYRHDSGELSTVQIELAGMGTRRIRIANLPSAAPDRAIRDKLSIYGDVKEIREETWPRAYRYPVSNGTHIAATCLKKHVQSHLSIAGNRVLISYEGATANMLCCNEADHQYHEFPRRRHRIAQQFQPSKLSWVDIVQQGTTCPHPELVRHSITDM